VAGNVLQIKRSDLQNSTWWNKPIPSPIVIQALENLDPRYDEAFTVYARSSVIRFAGRLSDTQQPVVSSSTDRYRARLCFRWPFATIRRSSRHDPYGKFASPQTRHSGNAEAVIQVAWVTMPVRVPERARSLKLKTLVLGPGHLASGRHGDISAFDPPFDFPSHSAVLAVKLYNSPIHLRWGINE
jgi:hypothetical protein